MLIKLSIKNFALIDDLDIDFEDGLNILTGETGAGKSIIIDAISVIVGERASNDYVRTGKSSCEVEAIFDYDDSAIDDVLEEYGIDPEESCLIVNRQITDQGRSYCRVNGKTVPVSVLKKIGKQLVDIHGQHQHQSLLDSERHIRLLDLLGDKELEAAKQDMLAVYKDYVDAFRVIQQLKQKCLNINTERDRLRHEVDEIDKAAPKVDEEILLEEQRQILENAEKIFNVLDFAYCTIYEGYEIPSIIDNLGKVVNSFEDIKEYFRPISPSTEYLSSVLYELEDLATNLRNYRETIDFDMGKLDEIHGRLELLDRLKNKYHMNIGELLKYRDEAAARLEEAMNLGDEIEELTQNLNAVKLNLANKALALHALRKETAKKLETDISGELHDLGMKDIKFSVDFKWDEGESGIEVDNKTVKINEEGIDKVEFLISTNPGEPLKPLVKIVSGGETSRIMLALKNIMAKIDNIPCLIFDEIDAGIGGRAAQTVGEKLSQIALNHQTLCVTHSPQIASQGDAHYLIKKEVSEGQTYTNVIQIQHQDRVNELARMLGGLEITNNTIAHAREMLNFAKEAKKQKKA